VTSGIISVVSEYLTMTAADEATKVTYRTIRVDTPINSGNSGGGLYDAKGELIGIVNAKLVSSSVENIGFAIPLEIVQGVAENIIDHCFGKEQRSVMRALLGVTLKTAWVDMAYDEESGRVMLIETVKVEEIEQDSLADGLLMTGDVLRAITVGERTVAVSKRHHLIDAMLYARVGDTVTLEIERDGEKRLVRFDITEACMTAY
jgi:serine protease Do